MDTKPPGKVSHAHSYPTVRQVKVSVKCLSNRAGESPRSHHPTVADQQGDWEPFKHIATVVKFV